jgi:hypothetical protein
MIFVSFVGFNDVVTRNLYGTTKLSLIQTLLTELMY